MPGERDIRETGDLLEGRFGRETEIIPLFGWLSAADQQRVFAPLNRRKIVVATNIAETSLTIPGIRYVIDSGLARISRYNPRTRTKRLPVEAISQSSANQRKGRSGRVQDGVCIRLYSEEDFAERPQYTQPEIQRANLAEVILRMKAYRLGDIETFPFVNPPPPSAIQGGYLLLQELGALEEVREQPVGVQPSGCPPNKLKLELQLRQLGHDLSRLPIDPTLGRMLLQSQHEHAMRELLIIAAGLSIRDPRARPQGCRRCRAQTFCRSAVGFSHAAENLGRRSRPMGTSPHAGPAPKILQGQLSLLSANARVAGFARAVARCLGRFGPVQAERQQCGLRRDSPLNSHRPAWPRRAAQGTQSVSRDGQPADRLVSRLGFV